MGNGLIFPYLLQFRWDDAWGEARPADGRAGLSGKSKEGCREIRIRRVSR